MADNAVQSEQTSSTDGRTSDNTPPQPRIHARNVNNFNLYNREGVFMHYLFLNLTMRYTRYFKPVSRRLIEFFTLMNALGMLALLIYIHFALVRSTSDCLNHVSDIWPRNGILRAQVSYNETLPNYKLYFASQNLDDSKMSVQSTGYNMEYKYTVPIQNNQLSNLKQWQTDLFQKYPFAIQNLDHQSKDRTPNTAKLEAMRIFGLFDRKCPVLVDDYVEDFKLSILKKLASVMPHMTMVQTRDQDGRSFMDDEFIVGDNFETVFSPFEPSPIRSYYAIEYSSEFGYLRLSSEARSVLAIPTLVVNLNPDKDQCFGSGLKKFMLETFLGYDDYLMTSIKKLAEKDNSQGYLRNLVTGEYFRFVTLWVNHASVIIAFSAMIVFTLIVTMLLRYSYHQIFMFMVEVLRLLDTDTRLAFPAAPMLTIILALVGMEEIMTEFFHDSTVAFYVILIIWAADQFDVICLHTMVGRRHWVRFFYLYHFSFYIYHYRFNGQYSKLALFTSWLLILHSMLYFLHHYELPAIHRQILVLNERNRQHSADNSNNNNNGNNRDGGAQNTQPTPADDQPQAPPTEPADQSNNPVLPDLHDGQDIDLNDILNLPVSGNNTRKSFLLPLSDIREFLIHSLQNIVQYVFGKSVFKIAVACLLSAVGLSLLAVVVHNNLSPGLSLQPMEVYKSLV
ncbi:membralin-like [Ciona intestinalis]